MWINDEVNLPEALIDAQHEGQLVVFAGAGVSMGPPSNLPSFEALADAVAQGVLPRKAGEPLDAFLGRVEQHGVDVQTRTRKIIDVPASLPRDLHHSIVKLFRSQDSLRLVTTNFDRHFTVTARAQYPTADTFIGPALPLGREFSGIVYMHGAVEHPRSHLVLTDRDFGQAYLADGWATRFLMDMFRKYAVLFVGYSHQDPVMRYLARSFVGGTSRYSLTPSGQDDFWTNLGVVPVHFPLRASGEKYGAIDTALASWSKRAGMGAFDHKARITQLAETPPPVDPESLDYLRSVLKKSATLTFFVETATHVEWVRWVEEEAFFAPLLQTSAITSAEPRMLAHWFAERYAVVHGKEAFKFVQRHSANLNSELSQAIAFQLAFKSPNATGDTLRLWAAALLAIPTTSAESLAMLLDRCLEASVTDAAALIFRFLLRPKLKFERPWPAPDFGGPLTLSVDITLGADDHDLREAWDLLKAGIDILHRDFLPMIEEYLRSTWALLKAAGRVTDDWDPMSFGRPAIEPHEQNRASREWGLLVDVARDLLDWAAERRPILAAKTVDEWMAATPLLLKRLAIYGTAKRTDVSADDALVLVEQQGWLYETSLKHEVFLLLERTFPKAMEAAQRRFVAYSMSMPVLEEHGDPERKRIADYERYNLAVWLRRIAPESSVAGEHFDALQMANPDFGPRDHPDMSRWISAGFRGPRSPLSAEDLLAKTPAEAAIFLIEYKPTGIRFDEPDRHGLLTMFEKAVPQGIGWALALAAELVSREEWQVDAWNSLINAWRGAELDREQWRSVIDLIDVHPEIVAGAPMAVANFLEQGIRRKDLEPDDVDTLERISDRVLAATDEPAGIQIDGATDWLTSAINHPAGEVALMLLRALSYRMERAGEDWTGLPEAQRNRFEALLGGGSDNAVMAAIALASQVDFLFHADRGWTEAHILPRFDWTADPARAAQAWDGFLTWGQWNEALFKEMEPFVRQTFARVDDLGGDAEGFVTRLAAVAALLPNDPWKAGGWLFDFAKVIGPEHRARWAEHFGRYAESLSVEGRRELWNRWVAMYWDDRITGLPQPLGDKEKEAMISWLVPFRDHASEVVDRIATAPPQHVDHFTFYRLDQSGLATSHASQIGRLLRRLLQATQAIDYDTGELLKLAKAAFQGGAAKEDLLVVADEMARLGLAGAAELKTLVDPT